MNSKNRYQSNTTFSKRPGIPQISSYVVFTLETVLFYAVILPNFDSRLSKIAFAICYSASLVALITTTLVSSSTDPSDPIMIKYRNGSAEEFEQYRKNNKQKLLYCDYCRSFVREKSRHCRTCDRCVENFDHHCMWINNCVGDQNYKSFMLMILSAFCNLTIYVLSVIVLTLEHRFDLYLGGFVTAWISGSINSIFAVLLVNLIFLHIYLICNGLSTYEFIMAQREEEKKRKEQQLIAKNSAPTSGINKRDILADEQSKNEQLTNEQIKMNDNSKGSENVIYVQSSKGSHRQEQPIPRKNFNDGREVQSIIFGEKEMTEKSEGFNQNELEQQKNENENQNSDDDESSSIQISQLFTRNKSLKLIIGKSDYYKPHKAKKKEQEIVRQLKTKSMFANIKGKK